MVGSRLVVRRHSGSSLHADALFGTGRLLVDEERCGRGEMNPTTMTRNRGTEGQGPAEHNVDKEWQADR